MSQPLSLLSEPGRNASAVVLLSGGLDSTVNAAEAARCCASVLALTCDYGQRSAGREVEAARRIAAHLGISHRTIDLRWLGAMTRSALIPGEAEPPTPAEADLDDGEAGERTAAAVWIPNRNGLFLNVAAAFAESLEARWVIPGFNAEEATTFPDNSAAFIEAVNVAFTFSTRGTVRVHCFTSELTKTAIFRRAREIDAPIWLSWPCYLGGETPCGACESCVRFRRGLRESGCADWFEERRADRG